MRTTRSLRGNSNPLPRGPKPLRLATMIAWLHSLLAAWKRIRGKRRRIAYGAEVRGRIVGDVGAEQAITQRKASLLASGVVSVDGHFAPMDVISIVGRDGGEFARGLANCASHDTEALLGKKIPRDDKGKRGSASPVLIRRDNIVLMKKT